MKIETNISEKFKEIKVIVEAPKIDSNVQSILNTISEINKKEMKEIIGEYENKIYLIPIQDILCFYSDLKHNYCQTKEKNYRIKNTLYELEEKLNKNDWIRISNSCIVNLNQIKCFDMGTVGSIVVILKNDEKRDVSKRKIKEIIKILKLRR